MAIEPALAHLDSDLPAALERLFTLLRIPSISTDPDYAEYCRECAFVIEQDLESLGFTAKVHETPGNPVLVAHRPKPGAPHVLFYGHYDIQPVDPLDLWQTDPFEPRVDEIEPGRKAIIARGAADDKGQVMTFIEACRALLATTGDLPVGVTVLLEGEEENGSINLPAFLTAHKDELKADVALVCDTGMWDRQTPAITGSLRGLVYEEIIVRCADRDLHSGLFGGAARNPVHVLSKIIADLHDADGRVAIPGFYDGVAETPANIKAQWAALDLTPEGFLGPIGLSIPAGERDRMVIEMIQSRPTCDVNGIVGGYTGVGAKTVIAAQASAKVSFRLVGQQNPAKVREAFRAFAKARVPADCSIEFIAHKGSGAVQLDWNMPQLASARAALQAEWGKPAVVIGSGGSIPVVGDFKTTLGLDTLLVGFGLDDDRVHSPNEKYDLACFTKGARSWVRILDALAG